MPSPVENFPDYYDKTIRLQKELEKFEVVSAKLKEKYKSFGELVTFVEYLRATEVVFTEAESQRWNDDQIKSELIKNEIYMMSLDTGVDEKVFRDIHDDFQTLCSGADQVYAVAEKLLEKYKNCPECQNFIYYLRDISLVFIEFRKEGMKLDEAKERLFKARMKVLSIDGQPELSLLEKIYGEFKADLGIKEQ